MTNQSIIRQLTEDARRQGFKTEPEDAAQTAITLALNEEPGLKAEKLLHAASQLLKGLKSQERQRQRRGSALASTAANELEIDSEEPHAARATRQADGVHRQVNKGPSSLQPSPRKQSRKERRPKGVALSHTADSGLHMLPTSEGNAGTASERFAAAILAEVELPRIAGGEPYSPEVMQALCALYQSLHGVAPEFHWAYVLMNAVEEAALQGMAHSESAHQVLQPEASEVTFSNKAGKKQKPIEVVSKIYPTVPGRAVRKLTGKVDGQEKLLSTETMTTEPATDYAVDSAELPERILNIVRLRLTNLRIPQKLAPYADNPSLIGWLLVRLGFGGGGGLNKVKNETLKEWLCDPELLATQVERYADRRASSASEDQAALFEERLHQLAHTIRAAAKESTTSPHEV